MNLKKNFRGFAEITAGVEKVLLWIATVLLLTDVLLGIAARYVEFEIVFADELGKYLFIWLAMVGVSAATKDNQHVRLTFIASRLPVSRRSIAIISQLLFLACFLFLFYWSFALARMHFLMEKSVMGFHFPMHWFTAALPFGFALTSLRITQDLVGTIRRTQPAGLATQHETAIHEHTWHGIEKDS